LRRDELPRIATGASDADPGVVRELLCLQTALVSLEAIAPWDLVDALDLEPG
jgi:hypothetical protein